MKKNNTFRRAAALLAALSITVSLAAPAFADTYYIDYGDITVTKNADGSQTIQQGTDSWTDAAGEETVITTSNTRISTLESDLEGPAAEDSDFGPVVEDNYQPAQPEDAEKPEGAAQPESAEEPKSADRQESADQQAQPQQAAPAAAPAGATPVNGKGNGVFGNTIKVINDIADKVLNLTLKDVKIDVSDTGGDNFEFEDDQRGKAALSVQGDGNVEIELDGNNELKSGASRAGLEKTSTGKLTLKDDNKEAGSLTATGGASAAGIGGDWNGSGENITITGGTVDATGGYGSAGIGGGKEGKGENITITGGTVTATGAYGGAGIGGGVNGIGSKVTVSGAAQVTATATGSSPDWSGVGTGATIGNGGSKTPDGPVDGKEIQADISGLTTGYIHHIIYNPDLDSDGILKEWWEFALPKPIPDGESLDLHVETLKGAPLLFNTRQQGSTLRVTTDNLSARLHGTRQALETLQEQGVEQIQFVTTLKTTTLSVEDLLAEGGQLVCPGARRPCEPAAERSSGRKPEVLEALKNTDPSKGPPWGITRGGLFFVIRKTTR